MRAVHDHPREARRLSQRFGDTSLAAMTGQKLGRALSEGKRLDQQPHRDASQDLRGRVAQRGPGDYAPSPLRRYMFTQCA
jgi:hypothetical protein